jgi:hypothetical protein
MCGTPVSGDFYVRDPGPSISASVVGIITHGRTLAPLQRHCRGVSSNVLAICDALSPKARALSLAVASPTFGIFTPSSVASSGQPGGRLRQGSGWRRRCGTSASTRIVSSLATLRHAWATRCHCASVGYIGRRRILTLAAVVAAEGASADGCERSLYVLQAGGSGRGGGGEAPAAPAAPECSGGGGSSTGGAQGSGGGFTGGARRIIGLSEAKALQLDRALHSAGTTSGRSTAKRRRGEHSTRCTSEVPPGPIASCVTAPKSPF